MSAIAGITAPEPAILRVQRTAPASPAGVPASVVVSQPARAAPTPLAVTPDGSRDARFEPAPAAVNAHVVRQVVQQITATLAYGAHVSVVSNGTSIHATIDISG